MSPAHLTRISLFTLLIGILGTGAWMLSIWSTSQPVVSAAVLGASTTTLETSLPTLEPYPVYLSDKQPVIKARQYVLYNPESGKILYQSDSLDPVPIASTTKIMTAYLVATYGNLDDEVVVSSYAASRIGSSMNLLRDQRLTVKSLLYGTLLVSGNDAANALAEYLGGKLLSNENTTVEEKIAATVAKMNETAAELDMTSTHYMDPAGLNDEGRSNALDLAKLTTVFNQNSTLQSITSTPQITVTDVRGRTSFNLTNSNRITVAEAFGNLGGKTGFTPDAGHCLVSSMKRNGMTLTAVILSTYSNANDASAIEARKLLEYGFENVRLD